MSKVTSWLRFRFNGQIRKAVTPAMDVELQPNAAEKVESDKEGVLGGKEVAVTYIVLKLGLPVGSLSVNVIVYVPLGKVIGNGVRSVDDVELNGVPLFVVKVQLTLVVDEILLPVEIKVNKTLDPAQTES